jgi:hypothetical protein
MHKVMAMHKVRQGAVMAMVSYELMDSKWKSRRPGRDLRDGMMQVDYVIVQS